MKTDIEIIKRLKDLETAEIFRIFSQGLAAGLDPDSPGRSSVSLDKPVERKAVTKLRSRWFHQRCKVCGHTFRLGDEVCIFQNGQVVHALPGLNCYEPKAQTGDLSFSKLHAEFFAGLNKAWPLSTDVPVIRLETRHPLLAPPYHGHSRASCRVCGQHVSSF